MPKLYSLPAYRSAIASVINRVALAYAGADIHAPSTGRTYNSSSLSGGSISSSADALTSPPRRNK
jgi:hypothetical protein